MKNLTLTRSWQHEMEIIGSVIRDIPASDNPIEILEAGCGNRWDINLDGLAYTLTGVDLDEEALNIRKNSLNDLDRIIVGDLCTIKLESNAFDVIYNSFVLEHIKDADIAMFNFLHWLKPGGILIVRIPDPLSVQGFFTKLTPHWFHVFYYRHILNYKTAGSPGYAPYPTHYHSIASREGMKKFCGENQLKIIQEYGDGYYRPGRNKLIQSLIHTFKHCVSAITFGKISKDHTNLLFILQKT